MNAARLALAAWVVGALTAPLTCVAATPPMLSIAAQNCAQALASRLHARLARVDDQPNLRPAPWRGWPVANQLIVRAYSNSGRRSIPMVCTYDEYGRVVSLHRPTPVGYSLINISLNEQAAAIAGLK